MLETRRFTVAFATLKKMIAGMATRRPTPVAMSASAMAPMTAEEESAPASPMPRSWSKAMITPMTVPKSPTKGALEPTVARTFSPRS